MPFGITNDPSCFQSTIDKFIEKEEHFLIT